jgi:hypothetical protein
MHFHPGREGAAPDGDLYRRVERVGRGGGAGGGAEAPTGIEGIDVTDKAVARNGVIGYGAIGVGGTKMKIHKAAVAELFARNDAVLDIDEIYQIALRL